MIQVSLDSSLAGSARTVCPGKLRGSEQRVLVPGEQTWGKGPGASSDSEMPLSIHFTQDKAPCCAPCQLSAHLHEGRNVLFALLVGGTF